MRFYRPKPGTTKTKKVFLFFPKRFDLETRWLEFAEISMLANILGEWCEVGWHDRKDNS